MKTSVLSIQPVEGTHDFKVLVLMGNDTQQFLFTIEQPKQDPFVVIGGDINFCKLFSFNQHISAKVGDLVGEVYRGEIVDLPIDVGNFYTPEEAIARQKHFPGDAHIIDTQLTEEIRKEVRNRAITLLEKLPDSMLDEAVKFLESLYITTSNTDCDREQTSS